MKPYVELSIWMTMFSVIISILTYYEIVRYIKMYVYSNKCMIEEYKKMSSKLGRKNVVISLDTDNYSPRHLKGVINSLYDQTYPVKRIQVNVTSDVYTQYRTDIDILRTNVFVNVIEKDYGKNNNVMPIILFEKNDNLNIICVNDKFIYSKDFVETMMKTKSEQDNVVKMKDNSQTDVYIFELGMVDIDFVDDSTNTPLFDYLQSKGVSVVDKTFPETYKNIL